MKTDLHPEYHAKTKVTCSCGTSFTVGSTLKDIEVEVCSACHPFYTGKGKLVDTAGKVDKYQSRKKAAAEKPTTGKKARKDKDSKRREARAKRLEEESKKAIEA